MRVAVLGLGEAGSRYAADLASAGCVVSAYDPAPRPTPPGVRRAGLAVEAVEGADLVLSLTGALTSVTVAAEVAGALAANTCLADLNSSAPATKRDVERALPGSTAMADIAVLAPISRGGVTTPLLASGPGAERAATALRQFGAPVEVLPGPVGAAAGRKLLRSVFMKGLAAAVLEAVTAGEAAGCAQWVRDQVAQELGPEGPALVERVITGTRLHAERRFHEVRAAADYLAELGVPADVCGAGLAWLDRVRVEAVTGP